MTKHVNDCYDHFSNPNMPGDITPYLHAVWPEYDTVNQRYLRIGLNMTSVKQHFNARSTAFWTKLIPAIVKDATKSPSVQHRSPLDILVG